VICEKQKKIKNRNFFFLISFLFLTSLLSIKTLKKVNTQDIRISGSELFSQNDVIKNSSLNFPIRLIFVETNLLEKELKQNLSLKNVSVNRELFPFGLKVHINSRIPIAYGERILNDEKILGFIDKDGIFINKQNVDEKNLDKLTIQVFGWKEKFKKILSEIFIAIDNYELDIIKITFSSDGFLTVEEKDLKTIFLGFNSNLINYQLQIINNLKNEFKKKNFLQVGGFSSMRFGEDLDLTYRLLSSGAKSSIIKTAYVYHKRRNNLIGFFNQIFSSGNARVKLNQKHKGTFRFFHLLPSLFFIFFVFMCLLLLFKIDFNFIFLIQFIYL